MTATDPMPGAALARPAAPNPDLPTFELRTFEDVERYCAALGDSSLLPRAFRGSPANILVALEYGRSLGLMPITAMQELHVIDGKVTTSAGLVGMLVRRAGHKLRTWIELGADGTPFAVSTIVRADDPKFEYRSTWTVERAIRAGLLRRTADGGVRATKERSAWDTYLESMLKARSVTEVARDACEEALLGVHYTPEELGASVDGEGRPVQVEAAEPHRASPPQQRPAAPAPPEPAPIVDAVIVDDPPAPAPAPAQQPDAQQLETTLKEALGLDDLEELRGIYARAGDARGIDVSAHLARLGVDRDVLPRTGDALGTVLIAIGKFVAENGRPVLVEDGEQYASAADIGGPDPWAQLPVEDPPY